MSKLRILNIDDSDMVGGQHVMIREIWQRLDKTRFDVLPADLGIEKIRNCYESVGIPCKSLGPAGTFKSLRKK